jgi:hypothetical protein
MGSLFCVIYALPCLDQKQYSCKHKSGKHNINWSKSNNKKQRKEYRIKARSWVALIGEGAMEDVRGTESNCQVFSKHPDSYCMVPWGAIFDIRGRKWL